MIFSCSPSRKNCPYLEDFGYYMKSKFNVDVTEKGDHLYYIIPLESCIQCIDLNLGILERIKTSSHLTLILVGRAMDGTTITRVKEIGDKFRMLKDPTGLIWRYETGLGKPLLIHTRDGDCQLMESIDDSEDAFILGYLRANS